MTTKLTPTQRAKQIVASLEEEEVHQSQETSLIRARLNAARKLAELLENSVGAGLDQQALLEQLNRLAPKKLVPVEQVLPDSSEPQAPPITLALPVPPRKPAGKKPLKLGLHPQAKKALRVAFANRPPDVDFNAVLKAAFGDQWKEYQIAVPRGRGKIDLVPLGKPEGLETIKTLMGKALKEVLDYLEGRLPKRPAPILTHEFDYVAKLVAKQSRRSVHKALEGWGIKLE